MLILLLLLNVFRLNLLEITRKAPDIAIPPLAAEGDLGSSSALQV